MVGLNTPAKYIPGNCWFRAFKKVNEVAKRKATYPYEADSG